MVRHHSRVQVLGRRVGWLDRHRRKLSIAITLVLCPLMLLRATDMLGSDWPRFHAVLMVGVIGIVMWAVVETTLAWLTAMWETECAHLLREQRIPRAVVHRSRRLTLFRK